MNKSIESRIVNELVDLQQQAAAISARQKELKARLSTAGLGTYEGAAGTATVFERDSVTFDKKRLEKDMGRRFVAKYERVVHSMQIRVTASEQREVA